jgi:hypothetical protein
VTAAVLMMMVMAMAMAPMCVVISVPFGTFAR